MMNKRKITMAIALAIWLSLSTYFAAFEIDDRLRMHYNTKEQVEKNTLDDVKKMVKDTPAGKELL